MYQVAVSGFTCTRSAYLVLISPSRSAGGWSNIQSAVLFSTAVTCASGVYPNFWTIESGLPSGCASADHSLKCGLRTRTICLVGAYVFHMYGPVPAGGMFTLCGGVLAGSMNANGTESLSRNSGSASVSANLTVLPSTVMPDRSQVFGVFRHASAPWMTLYQEPAFGLSPILKMRLKVALTSLPVSGLPSENLIPGRSLNVQVFPPFVGFGIAWARSGTIFVPSLPLARLNPTRPSCVTISSCHSCRV